jgi:multicomponent K+:H+ antiporter subunit D
VTIAIGAFGVLGARRLLPLIAFSVLGSMGTLLVAVAAFSPQATTAALYYIVHSTFAAAVLFLVADLVVARRRNDRWWPDRDRQNGADRGAVLRRRDRDGGDAAAVGVPGQAPGPDRRAPGRAGWPGPGRRSSRARF